MKPHVPRIVVGTDGQHSRTKACDVLAGVSGGREGVIRHDGRRYKLPK